MNFALWFHYSLRKLYKCWLGMSIWLICLQPLLCSSELLFPTAQSDQMAISDKANIGMWRKEREQKKIEEHSNVSSALTTIMTCHRWPYSHSLVLGNTFYKRSLEKKGLFADQSWAAFVPLSLLFPIKEGENPIARRTPNYFGWWEKGTVIYWLQQKDNEFS